MRRGLTILLVLALVFAGAALAGFWLAARLAPERLRIESERQLARVLEGEVRLASLELARSSQLPWIWLEARGARAILKDDITILAGKVRARLDPLSLLLGRLGIADLQLDDVVVLFPPRPDDHPERTRLERILRPIEVTGAFLRKHPCGIPDLEVRSLTALVPRDGALDVLLEAGDGSLRCAGLRRDRANASLSARVRRGDETFAARFGLRMSHEAASLAVAFDAAPLGGLLGTVGIDVPLTGELRGNAKLQAPAEGAYALDVSVTGRRVSGPLPERRKDPWLELALAAPRLTGRVTVDGNELRVPELELVDGGIQLSASGSLARPTADASAARLRLELGAMELRDANRLLGQLPEATRLEWTRALERMERGRFTRIRADAEGTLATVRGIFATSPLDRPGALRLRGGVRDATLRVGEEDRIEGVDAHVVFDGERLDLSVPRGALHGRPLPNLKLALTGIANVRALDELDCREPRSQPPLPGIRKLQTWLGEDRADAAESEALAWSRLALEIDWVSHPALGCSLEQVEASVEPAEGGLDFAVARGVWAGLAIEADGGYRTSEDPERLPGALQVTAVLGPPFEAMRLDPPASPWLSGRYRLEATRMGRWHVDGAEGRVRLDGSSLVLPSTLRLADTDLQGRIRLELGGESLPFEAQAQFTGLDLRTLWNAADLERGALHGSLFGAGAISGELQPGLNPLGAARGLIAMHARDGTVNQKIPVMLAIALASDEFDPFGTRDELPYDAIDAVARVEDGKIAFELLQLHARTLRMAASGGGAVVEPYAVEGVVGLFFFPGLDSMIDRVPILNRVILGENRNLVGAYFSLTGRWGEPQASLIPIQTIATGPTGFLTEGLPSFVMGGIRRIQSVIVPSEEEALPPTDPRADS